MRPQDDPPDPPETARGDKRQPPRGDPRTGEVPAGPGDAGLTERATRNRGTPGTGQMSNRRLGLGIALTVVFALGVAIVAALF
jgi:hypothetical protein